jgi:hypothetical protein
MCHDLSARLSVAFLRATGDAPFSILTLPLVFSVLFGVDLERSRRWFLDPGTRPERRRGTTNDPIPCMTGVAVGEAIHAGQFQESLKRGRKMIPEKRESLNVR